MIPFLIFLAATVKPMKTEKNVVLTLEKSRVVYEKFISDTVKFRGQIDSFTENEYVPAVNDMISLLDKGQCQACLIPYLESLKFYQQSANEDIAEQSKI